VLVIEDDQDMRILLGMFLELHGYQVAEASDGDEGLRTLRAVRLRTPGAPCIVILDLMMPRMDGRQFRTAQRADAVIADVPIVVVSGVGDVQRLTTGLDAVAVLRKPVDFDRLLQIVEEQCVR
jgi:DNA-binding response OmpR family regulator